MKYREQTEIFWLTVESPAGRQITRVPICDLHYFLLSGEPRAYIVTGSGIAGRITSYFQVPGDPFTSLPCIACSGQATIDRPVCALPS